MYKNVGKKIKSLVRIIVTILIVLNILIGSVMFLQGATDEEPIMTLSGILVAMLGSFLSWISGLTLYAFGEIADGVQKMAGDLSIEEVESQEKEEPLAPAKWVCKACGTENSFIRTTCSKCKVSNEWYDVE